MADESYTPNAKPCGCPLWMECDHPQPAKSAPPIVEARIEPYTVVRPAETLFTPAESAKLARIERENAELKKEVEQVKRKQRTSITVDRSEKKSSGTSSGIGIGNVIAVLISWSLYHDWWWAAIHGIFGWAYVIYYLLSN